MRGLMNDPMIFQTHKFQSILWVKTGEKGTVRSSKKEYKENDRLSCSLHSGLMFLPAVQVTRE
jgi:hypothetical protein